MLILLGVLILIACVLLGVIILVQNPKGGGVTGALGGFSNQLIGVKQTTDVLEKGTWILAAVVAVLCIITPAFTPKNGSTNSANDQLINNVSTKAAAPAAAPSANTATMGTSGDTMKK